jgi:thiol-disulfide isomerase/thioredoxin
MRLVPIQLLFVVAAATAGAPLGCDRGDHPGQLDKPAPVFAINDGQHSVDLAKLRGHVVLVNFWATWCAPCIEELPSLELMQQELPQVQVVAIDSSDSLDGYQRFLTRRPVKLLTVFDAKPTPTSNALYGSFAYPETYVIDKNGVVRRKFIGPQEWTSPEILDYLRKLAS